MIMAGVTIPLHRREMMEPWSWLTGMHLFNPVIHIEMNAKSI